MSTPMRHGPSQQGKTPSTHTAAVQTPQASTPFSASQGHAAFSPHGPRSSPQQFKNTPGTMTTATMGQANNAGAPVNFDSPSAAAAFGALGMNDLNLDNLSMGGFGGTAGRSDEEEFKRKLDNVIEVLWNARSARVSNEGLERVAKHVGLECLWEDNIADNSKILVIAGTTMSVEIAIANHIVRSATLAFFTPVPIVDKHVNKASAILKKDLSLGENQSPLTKKLSSFWVNLERLRDLDKLSVTPGLNCHEAIAGVYESLEKLHQWDLHKLSQDPMASKMSEEQSRMEALCTRHGLPQMHVRGRIGLSLDYWKDKRKLIGNTVSSEQRKTWGILVGCMAMSNMVYTPVRVSDKWIGPNVEKSNLSEEDMMSEGPVVEWLEPESTLLAPSEEAKSEPGADPTSTLPKPPDVCFQAIFDPPIIVSHAAAAEIYKFAATSPPQPSDTYDTLLFPTPAGVLYDPSEPRMIEQAQVVPVFPKLPERNWDNVVYKVHKNTLHIYKPVYGQVLQKLPFSHPRELIQMLPALRQWAFLSTLLFNSFRPKASDQPQPEEVETEPATTKTNKDEYDNFLAEPATGDATPDTPRNNRLAVDITLTAHPIPRLQIVFPFKGVTANVLLEIQLGGKVHIVSHNVFSEGSNDAQTATTWKEAMRKSEPRKWAGMLETTEDIGYWVEMIREVYE